MAFSIGIKIANGEFYPVVEEGSTVKKRLIVTTVHDGQRSVQIDLYRSASKTMSDATYIGSLVVEDIAPKPKGDPSIELIIAADGNQEVSAEAIDLDLGLDGDRQRLSVSLQALNEENRSYEMPDFELEPETQPPSALYEKPELPSLVTERRSAPTVLYVLLGIAGILIIVLLLWLFVFRHYWPKPVVTSLPVVTAAESVIVAEPLPALIQEPEPVPPAENELAEAVVPRPKPVVVNEVATELPPAPVVQRVRPPAPVKSYQIPSVIPQEGFAYKIRWGDTLWDIAEVFYRNPWLYPKIARFNKIPNPDLIISGTYLLVPPK